VSPVKYELGFYIPEDGIPQLLRNSASCSVTFGTQTACINRHSSYYHISGRRANIGQDLISEGGAACCGGHLQTGRLTDVTFQRQPRQQRPVVTSLPPHPNK
jgi:hypothetical protein